MNLNILIWMTLSSINASVGSLFLKKSHEKNFTRYFLLGLLLYFFSIIFLLKALTLGELSIVFNISALTYIFSFIFGIIFIKEKITLYKLFGIFVIIFGIFLLFI